MEDIVFRGANDQAVTSSLLIAEKFGKSHDNVLRDIRNLIQGVSSKMTKPQCSRKQPILMSKINRLIQCS